jgi:dihydrofolate synthase/folylpolyglutamate synthase
VKQALLHLSNKPRFSPGVVFERCSSLVRSFSVDLTSVATIGITGSNGKGSTSIILNAILSSHGIRTGLFTSPHFINPTERFRINGKEISEIQLEDLAREVLEVAYPIERKLGQEFSRFELLTVMAWLYFKRERVDIAILEAGIGGRYDVTRLANPELIAITSLDLEHTQVLGDTLEEIFADKLDLLGIRGKCFASITQSADLRDKCKDLANKKGVELKILEEDYPELIITQNSEKTRIQNLLNLDFNFPLLGAWQGKNAGLAVLIANEILAGKLSSTSIEDSLAEIKVPGRFERISSLPEIYVDSAHTPDALIQVVNFIQKTCSDPVIIFGISANKPLKEMVGIVSELNCPVFISASDHGGADPELLLKIFENNRQEVLAYGVDLGDIFKQAKSYALSHNKTLIALGGLFFAADVARLESGVCLSYSIYL